jgi:mannitol-1-phosphate 5-dehydrogenase
MKEVLIVGAGKIGRGFLGQLFRRSGYKLWFVDASSTLVTLLNREKRYRVDIAGENRDVTEYIGLEGAFTPDQTMAIGEVVCRVPILVSCVGVKNMDNTALYLKQALIKRNPQVPLNWLICENAVEPARRIREVLMTNATPSFKRFVSNNLGLVETQILRTGMAAKKEILDHEPLAVRMQNWWTLPLDKDAFVGPVPGVEGFKPKSNFGNELIRKLYTFNGTNGPIAYIGWANGYKILHEAALAYRDFFHEIQNESAHGLIREFGLDSAEQQEFMALAMKKYTDPALNDSIERNARDLKRKVGEKERLIGPAQLCLNHGKKPFAYAKAIAAAYCYDGSDDEGTKEVIQAVHEKGIEFALREYSGLDRENELYRMVITAYNERSFIF